MAQDSNMIMSPSVMTGTLPTGLSARHSGVARYSAAKSTGTIS